MSELELTIGTPGTPSVGAESEEFLEDEILDVEYSEAPPVGEDSVRAVLVAISTGASSLFGDPDVAGMWKFTPGELTGIVPPLTRIINNRPQLRRAVAKGDHLAVAIHLAGYLGRNVGDLKRAKEARADLDFETGPGMDPWQSAAGHGHGQPGGADGHGLRDGLAGGH